MHAVITENDESQWNDEPGQRYHFPARYKALLQPGTRLIYYKGTLRDPKFAASRLSPEPHYFATAIAGAFVPDTSSKKGDQFLPVEQFRRFPEAVPIRVEGELFETIPTSLQSNYWRYGVRPISAETYLAIIAAAGLLDSAGGPEPALTTYGIEGGKRVVYSTRYERDPKLRAEAVKVHGVTCFGCKFNFGATYGPFGEDFIHIHHLKPLGTAGGAIVIDPHTDLVPLCPNCHAMVHRPKGRVLPIDELRALLVAASAG